MNVALHGIPTCDSCRKAKKYLEARGVDFAWHDLRESPPSRATVAKWIAALGAKALKNTSGASYRALPDAKKTWNDNQWLDAFEQDAMLLKRPILVVDGVAKTSGFREERFEESLAD